MINLYRIEEIHRRLLRLYGERKLTGRKPPLDELIFTILSQHTSDGNRDMAWERLRENGQSWSSISELSAREIEKKIRVGGLARQKAKRIRSILRTLRKERGSPDLDFLADLDDAEIRRYLLNFPGVGPKTASCVLLFSLGRPAFPVDTHVHRVTTRLGFLARNTPAPKAHDILEEIIPPEWFLTLHLNLISHGRAVCRARHPACSECVLDDICPKTF
jgi:endonuclease-3